MEAHLEQFRQTTSNQIGEYVYVKNNPTIDTVGKYIIELQTNLRHKTHQRNKSRSGAITITEQLGSGFQVHGTKTYDELDDAKDAYRILVTRDTSYVESFLDKQIKVS